MIERLMTFHPPTISKAKTGENIRRLRKGHILTVRQLGAALHVRSQEISRWETGYVFRRQIKLWRLQHCLA